MLDLSVILVNYNGEAYLEKCLTSLLNAVKILKSEIIMVDNASSDKSLEIVKKQYPQVIIIKSDKNVGFGTGNNMALKKSAGRYRLLLNTDTEIQDPNLLRNMIIWMDKHPKVGVSSCGLKNADGTFQPTGGYFPTLPRVFAWMTFLDDLPVINSFITAYHPKAAFYKTEKQIDWVTGAFYLIREQALKEVGLFNEDYFMYVEEVDLSYRMKQKEWEIWFLPQYKIVHHGQAISGNEFTIIQEFKGLVIFYKSYFIKWQLFLLKFLLKLGALIRICIFGLLKGGKIAKVYFKAYQAV